MATRRAPIETPDKPPIDCGLTGADMGVPVLSIVHTSSKAFKKKRADFGDIIIGASSDDPESAVVHAQGKDPVRVIVVGPVEKWLAPKFKPGIKDSRRWDINDPEAPIEAEVNYRYTLLVPAYSEDLPVHFYVRGSGIGAMRPAVNKLKIAAGKGTYPYELAFDLSTEYASKDDLEWYVPSMAAAEPQAELVATARTFYGEISAANSRKQIAAASTSDADSDKPGF